MSKNQDRLNRNTGGSTPHDPFEPSPAVGGRDMFAPAQEDYTGDAITQNLHQNDNYVSQPPPVQDLFSEAAAAGPYQQPVQYQQQPVYAPQPLPYAPASSDPAGNRNGKKNSAKAAGKKKRPMTPQDKKAMAILCSCLAVLLLVITGLGVFVGIQYSGGRGVVSDQSDSRAPMSGALPVASVLDPNYLNETLFLGDSNTVRLYMSGYISSQQSLALVGMGITGAISQQFLYFEGDYQAYTIPEAVGILKPRRVVITFGTNNIGYMDTKSFISAYREFVQAVKAEYSYCDVIVCAVPPVSEGNSYPAIQQSEIDEYNVALANMCEKDNLAFLDINEVLMNNKGYCKADYTIEDGLHLSNAGLQAWIDYVETHQLPGEDRRPEHSDAPTMLVPVQPEPVPTETSSSAESSTSSSSSSSSSIPYSSSSSSVPPASSSAPPPSSSAAPSSTSSDVSSASSLPDPEQAGGG